MATPIYPGMLIHQISAVRMAKSKTNRKRTPKHVLKLSVFVGTRFCADN
jgi:hypothetical protein